MSGDYNSRASDNYQHSLSSNSSNILLSSNQMNHYPLQSSSAQNRRYNIHYSNITESVYKYPNQQNQNSTNEYSIYSDTQKYYSNIQQSNFTQNHNIGLNNYLPQRQESLVSAHNLAISPPSSPASIFSHSINASQHNQSNLPNSPMNSSPYLYSHHPLPDQNIQPNSSFKRIDSLVSFPQKHSIDVIEPHNNIPIRTSKSKHRNTYDIPIHNDKPKMDLTGLAVETYHADNLDATPRSPTSTPKNIQTEFNETTNSGLISDDKVHLSSHSTETSQSVSDQEIVEDVDTPKCIDKSSPTSSSLFLYDHKSIELEQAQIINPIDDIDNVRPSFNTLRKRTSKKQVDGVKLVPFAETFEMYKENAKKTNDPKIQFEFAKFCINAGEKYVDEGLWYLRKLSHSGYSEAQYFLGLAYFDDARYDLAYRQYILAAKHNHAAACYEVAQMKELGLHGIKKNYKLAVEYYMKSACYGHGKAMYRIALAELQGQLGMKKNIKNGIKWLNRGASISDHECPEPLFELSLIYEVGIQSHVLADVEHSKSLLQDAVELEYPPAIHRMAYFYENGRNGFDFDAVKSIEMYHKAAERGYPDSQLAYAGWLISGYSEYLKKDPEEAYVWAHRAASKGLAKAEYTVGYFLEFGIGVAPNIKDAARWYIKSAKNGDELALQRLGRTSASEARTEKKRLFGFLKIQTFENEIEILRDRIGILPIMDQEPMKEYKFPFLNPILSIHKQIILLKSLVRENRPNVPEIRELIKNIETNIQKAKELQNKWQLKAQEQTLNHELQVLEYRSSDDYDYILNSKSTASYSNQKKFDLGDSDLPQEIKEYQRFIDIHGGKYGFWDEASHMHYLKLRSKFGARNELLFDACAEKIVGVTVEIAKQHEMWYREFCQMSLLKKNAITDWKKKNSKIIEKTLETIQVQPNQTNATNAKDNEKEKSRRQQIKMQLLKWKTSKENSEKENNSPNDNGNNDKTKKDIEHRKKIKETLRIYSERKAKISALESELTDLASAVKKKESSLMFAIENKRFMENDQKFIQKRNETKMKKKHEAENREIILKKIASKVLIEAERDPLRLFQPTIGYQMKISAKKDDGEKAKSRFEAPIFPRRQVPNWRRGI